MPQLTDLHCHILPYVDDGAQNLEEALLMLEMQAGQGVTRVILTPHRRHRMFETPDEVIDRQFARLCQEAASRPGLPRLLPGREYYCDEDLLGRMRSGPLQSLGGSGYLLMEFSSRYDAAAIAGYLRTAAQQGYRPVIAHAERYPCLQEDPRAIERLRALGAMVQINAGSVLGEEGWRQKGLCKRWLKSGWVDLVCTDSHRSYQRIPNLDKAYQYILKKFGSQTAARIFEDGPAQILSQAQKGEVPTR